MRSTLSLPWRGGLFAALGICFLCAAVARAGDGVRTVSLPQAGERFALDPETGGLATALAKDDRVVLYPKVVPNWETTGRVTANVGKTPVDIAFKKRPGQSLFIVLCQGGREAHLLDAATLKPIKRIPLQLNDPHRLAVSANPQDPFVYYTAGSGHGCRIAAIDLEHGTDLGAIGDESVADAVVSADGNLLYFRGPWGPTGFQSYALVRRDGKVAMRRLFYDHSSADNYVPDPFGQYVVVNGHVWSPHLDKKFGQVPAMPIYAGTNKIGTAPMAPLLISATRPVMFAIAEGRLKAISVNTLKVVGSVGVDVTQTDPFRNMQNGGPVQVFEAPRQARLVVCDGRKVTVVDYAALELPREPFLALQIDGAREAAVGEKFVLRVTPRDPAVKAVLTYSPEGMRLEDGALIWTPTAEQVGVQRAVVRAVAGDLEKANELNIIVRRPSLGLPFAVAQLVADEPGTTAVVSSFDGDDVLAPDAAWEAKRKTSRLAVIDLKGLKVTAQRKLPVGIGDIAVDSRYVYAALADSDAFLVLDRSDLKDVKRIFTSGRVRALMPVAETLLFVQTQDGEQTVLDVASLSPASAADVGAGIHLSGKGKSISRELPAGTGDGWWYDGIFYDAVFKKPRTVVRPRHLARLTPDGVRPPVDARPDGSSSSGIWLSPNNPIPPQILPYIHNDYAAGPPRPPQVPDWLSPWGVNVTPEGVRHGKRVIGSLGAGKPIAPNDEGPLLAVVLPDQPAVATLRMSLAGAGPDRPPRRRAEVRYHDLITAAPQVQMTLEDEPAGENDGLPKGAVVPAPDRFLARNGLLLALVGKRLHAIPTPKLDAAKFPPPMSYLPDQAVRVIEGDGLTVPLPKLQGARGPVEVTLRQEMEGVEIGKVGTQLELKAEPLLARAADGLGRALGRDFGDATDPARALDDYLREARPAFARLAGRPAKGVPFWLTLAVVAQDKELQSADAEVGVLLEVPEATVRARLKGKAIGAPPFANPLDTVAPPSPALLKRMAEMERRLDEINRKLDILLRGLGVPDKGPRPKEQP